MFGRVFAYKVNYDFLLYEFNNEVELEKLARIMGIFLWAFSNFKNFIILSSIVLRSCFFSCIPI